MQVVSETRPRSEYRRYLFTYHFRGTEWSLEVPALTLEEAKERVKVLPFARCDGELRRQPPPPAEPARRNGWFRRAG